MMKTRAAILGSLCAFATTLFAPQSVSAQGIAYPNEGSRQLGECIARSTTGADRILTARWFAASLGSAPQVSDVVTVDAEVRDQTNREMAALFTRLFTEDCAEFSGPLMRSNDMGGIQAAGGRLGQIAMQELMSDPQVMAVMMGYIAYVDQSAFDKLAQ